MDALRIHRQLKGTIRAGQPTFGIFVRTPAIQVIECLGQSGADFVVLDAEHAPFGVTELDHCILAGRSVGMPVLVRLGDPQPANILQVLDMGAAGIVVPHVGAASTARAAIEACHYKNGSRGFSGQHRAAGFGALPGARFRRASDASVIVIAQIEDTDGHVNIGEIAAVDELDAVFVGRADLAVSMGCDDNQAPAVVAATDDIIKISNKVGMTSGIFLSSAKDIRKFREQGVSLIAVGTDQSLLIGAARNIADEFRNVAGPS